MRRLLKIGIGGPFLGDDLVEAAGAAGFGVEAGYYGEDVQWAVVIKKELGDTTQFGVEAVRQEGQQLLERAFPWDFEDENPYLSWGTQHRVGGEGDGQQVWLRVKNIDSNFAKRVQQALAVGERERLEQQTELNLGFDRKIDDEIQRDPQILALGVELETLRRRVEAIEAARTERWHEMRAEKERQRGTFLDVAEGRGL